MLIIEVMLTVLLGGILVFLFLGWLLRPLFRNLREQLRLESQVEANRRAFEAERSRLRETARAEFEQWMKQRSETAGSPAIESLTRLQSPVLKAVLERYPLNKRVLELVRVYKQATGKDLLPPELCRMAEAGDGEDAPPLPPPSEEEARLLDEAKREVEAWLAATVVENAPGTEKRV